MRVLAPFVLGLVGVTLLIGCIPFTSKEKVVAGTDYRPVLGEQGQWLVDGRTTREQLVSRLGEPQYDGREGRFAAYYLRTHAGFWVVPLCFRVAPQERYRLLMLKFDSNGVLIKHELAREDEKPVYLNWQPGSEKNTLEADFWRWTWESVPREPTTQE